MMKATNTVRPAAANARLQFAKQSSDVRPASCRLAPSDPSTDVIVEFLDAPVHADAASDTFRADLAGEMTGLRSYAIWLCRSRSLADDLIQETLLKAWTARDRFQPGTNLRAWCITILRNVFLSYKRRSWRSLPFSDDMIAEFAAEKEELGHRLDLLALRNAIALLPRDQREALLLIGAGGASYIEAAKVCACAVGTVKSRVSRARLRLAVMISENKAGFNSDVSLDAEEALDDLMDQVSRLNGAVVNMRARKDASRRTSAVYSESA